MTRKKLGLFIGPILFLIVLIIQPFQAELSFSGHAVLALTLWMGTWWLSEVIPIAATALLPIVILPVSGGAPIAQTTAAYGDKMLFLFIGGFILAIAMQKWNLHKRIALNIINRFGSNANKLVLGFMIATGVLSMWISNTATTLMMVTIGMALISELKNKTGKKDAPVYKSLLLGIAYAASIAGVATLVGTPTNPIFASIAKDISGEEFTFLKWMSFALPFSVLMVLITWLVLTKSTFKQKSSVSIDNKTIQGELNALGKLSREERIVGVVFLITALSWITRSFLLNQLIPQINDTSIAIAAALSLFVITTKEGKPILTWDEAERLPWGVIILFGGGLSLAAAFKSSGLALWLGNQLSLLGEIHLFLLIIIISLSINFLTEITSNVATASIALPVLGALADVIGVHPYFLMIPATMAASCAFMLPIATGPNAIVFGSGELKINDMTKAGIWLNIISSLLISTFVYLVLPYFL